MSDIYKLQYNGMTIAFPGWNGYISFEDTAIPRNVVLNQQTGGTITADIMSGYDGDIINLSNTADIGYTFNTYNLTGATLTGNQFMFSGSDVTAEPDYIHNVYNVSITQVAGGSATASPTTGYYGTQVTLSNTANIGYTFGSYSITGATLTSNKFAFNDSDVTVKPNWNHTQYSVTLTQVAGGKIAASPTTGYYGTQVTLSNTPSAEYTFGSYSITGATLTSNKFNFGTSNVTAKGSFTQKSYTLTLQNDGHGTLKAGKTTGHKNDTTTLTATPNTNYALASYSTTACTVNGNTLTFNGGNCTAKANFNLLSAKVWNSTATKAGGTTYQGTSIATGMVGVGTGTYAVLKFQLYSNPGGGANDVTWYYNGTMKRQRCHFGWKSYMGIVGGTFTAGNNNVTKNTAYNGTFWYDKASPTGSWTQYKFITNRSNGDTSAYLRGVYVGHFGTTTNVTGIGKIYIGRETSQGAQSARNWYIGWFRNWSNAAAW